MDGVLIVIHGINNAEEIDNTKKILEDKIKGIYPNFMVKIAISSEKILKKLHDAGETRFKGIGNSIEEFYSHGVERVYLLMIYVNSGESYLKSLKIIKNYKNIRFTTPLLYDDKNIVYSFKSIMKKGTGILIFHGGKEVSTHEIDNFLCKLKKLSKGKISSLCIEEKDFLERLKEKIKESEKIYIYSMLINKGYHYKKNIILIIKKLKKDGYNVELEEKTLIDYDEICEIFIKKLADIVR